MGSGASQPQSSTKSKSFNYKPIHTAIRWNKISIKEIEDLLCTGEAVNCVDKSNGNCPIHIAAQNGHLNIIKLLIQKGANLNVRNKKGNTAIHMAVGYDYFEAAKIIMNAGGDPDMMNSMGVPAHLGLNGDKSMGIAAIICAKNTQEAKDALIYCEDEMSRVKVNKANFIAAGLKAKKALGEQWTDELQEKFKELTGRLS